MSLFYSNGVEFEKYLKKSLRILNSWQKDKVKGKGELWALEWNCSNLSITTYNWVILNK